MSRQAVIVCDVCGEAFTSSSEQYALGSLNDLTIGAENEALVEAPEGQGWHAHLRCIERLVNEYNERDRDSTATSHG